MFKEEPKVNPLLFAPSIILLIVESSIINHQVDAPAHFNHKLGILSLGGLKNQERFLNFALVSSASQQRAPVLSEKIIIIGLLFMEIFSL